jgi:hypothetical protein
MYRGSKELTIKRLISLMPAIQLHLSYLGRLLLKLPGLLYKLLMLL